MEMKMVSKIEGELTTYVHFLHFIVHWSFQEKINIRILISYFIRIHNFIHRLYYTFDIQYDHNSRRLKINANETKQIILNFFEKKTTLSTIKSSFWPTRMQYRPDRISILGTNQKIREHTKRNDKKPATLRI